MKALKIAGIVLLAVAAVVIGLTALLSVVPVRRAILNYALPRALDRAPGDLAVKRAEWPGLETVELAGVTWQVDGEDALTADTLAISVRLWPLLHKDFKARLVVAHGLRVNVPAIQSLTGGGEPDTARVQGGGGFLRAGAVPGLPSVAVDSLSVTAPHILIAEGREIIGLALDGSLDFSAGGSGMVRINHLAARGPDNTWRVDRLRLWADLEKGTLGGEGAGVLAPDFPLIFSVEGAGPDEFVVALTRERGLNPPQDPGLLARLKLERERGNLTGAGFDVDLRTPASDDMGAIPAVAERLKGFPANEGILVHAAGKATLKPALAVSAHTVVSGVPGLERAMVATHYADRTATVDSLIVALENGMVASTAGRVAIDNVINAGLEPIMLEVPEAKAGGVRSSWKPTGKMPARVTYSRRTRTLSIEGLSVVGDLGDITLSGTLDEHQTGELDFTAVWPRPPAPLLGLRGGGAVFADSLRAAWSADAPYSLKGHARLASADGGRDVRAQMSMVLPGPRNLAPLFAGGRESAARLAGLGPMEGDASLRLTIGTAPTELAAEIDLGRTSWIDTCTVTTEKTGDSFRIPDFLLRAGTLRLALSGEFNTGSGEGHAQVTTSDAGFLRRFSQSVPDFDLTATAGFTGLSRLDVALDGAVRGTTYDIGSIKAEVHHDAARTAAGLHLPEGMVSEYAPLDRVDVNLIADQRGDTIRCEIDTLRIGAFGSELAAGQPFAVYIDRTHGMLTVDAMRLGGSLGTVRADGYVGRDSMSISLAIVLDLPESPPPELKAPPGAWPRRVEANLDIPAADDIEMDATVEGFVLDDGGTANLDFALTSSGGSVMSNLAIDSGERRLVEGTVSLPAHLRAYPPQLTYHEGDVSLNLKLSAYPVLIQKEGRGPGGRGDLVASIDAAVEVTGPAAAPAAYADARITFPKWPDLADFSMAAESAVRPEGLPRGDAATRAQDLGRRVARALNIDSTQDLVAELTMNRASQALFAGHVTYPLAFSLDPFLLGAGEGSLSARLKSEGLPLEDMDVLLPPDVGLDGKCRLDLAAQGAPADPAVSGSIEMADLDIKYQQMLDVILDGSVKAAGTALTPLLTGNFSIRSGAINLPGAPKKLYPVEGPSILLDTAWRARIDSSEAGPPAALRRPAEAPRFRPDYDITLDISRGMWLRGEGLEVEFEGKVEVTQKDNKPVIDGEMIARRGTFLFLGRVFNLERGTISFYGEEQINPSMDITVTSTIDAYKVMIRLSGRLKKPELSLTSTPDLTEGDIMAMILFGKPLADLNEGQGTMLRERAADVLLTMGAAKLQQSLAGQAGIDVVSVRSARGEGDQGTALVVGKYLTPDLLVTYEQALQEKSTSYLVLEYMLTRYIKLETLYSNQNRSGVGISTEKNY